MSRIPKRCIISQLEEQSMFKKSNIGSLSEGSFSKVSSAFQPWKPSPKNDLGNVLEASNIEEKTTPQDNTNINSMNIEKSNVDHVVKNHINDGTSDGDQTQLGSNCNTLHKMDPKRLKRVLANRASAQKSRAKRIEYAAHLERKEKFLKDKISFLEPQIEADKYEKWVLEIEYHKLKHELAVREKERILQEMEIEKLKAELKRLRELQQQKVEGETMNYERSAADDAIGCLRMLKRSNFSIPIRGCEYLVRRVMKLNKPGHCWEFYLEVLDYGYPPKVYLFNILMHVFCKIGDVVNARLVFDEIPKRGFVPSAVSFNTLISGYCKNGNVKEGFVLKGVMESERISPPDVFTFSTLINGLCKESRLDEANGLFDEMCAIGLVPNSVTFTTLIDGEWSEA